MASKNTNHVLTETQKAFHQVKQGKVTPVAAVRYVTKRFPSLARADLLKIAEKEGINQHTANTQYYGVRAGRFTAPSKLG